MENSEEKVVVQQKQKRLITIVFVVLILAMPVVYLMYKSKGTAPVENEQAAAAPAAVNNIAELENLVTKDPSFTNLINLSMAYINNRKPGRSIDHLKKAIELKPTSAVAYNNLGVAYIMLEQYQNGIDACTKALELDPNFQLAKNNLKWGNDERAKTIKKIDEQLTVTNDKRDVKFYLDHGLNYFRIGDYGKSIEVWNKVFDLEPKNINALNSIGTAFMMKNQYDDAISIFEQALAINPNNQQTKNNLAWAKGEKEKTVKK